MRHWINYTRHLPVLMLVGCASTGAVVAKSPEIARSSAAAPKLEAATAAALPSIAIVDADIERAYIQAVNAMRQGRDAEAERGFRAVMQAQPAHTGPYANLAILYRKQGRFSDAERALMEAIKRSPRRVEYLNMLGILRREQGQFAAAAEAYEQALAADQNYADAHYNLGILYDLYWANYAKAAYHYQQFLQRAPGGNKEVKAWLDDVNKRIKASGE